MAGLLYVLTSPPPILAQWLFYGYVGSRLLHFVAYYTGQAHDVRASIWTIGSLIIVFMAVASLFHALGI
jgi:glutathione S-transferase